MMLGQKPPTMIFIISPAHCKLRHFPRHKKKLLTQVFSSYVKNFFRYLIYFIITLQCFLLLKNRHSLIHTLHTQQLDSLNILHRLHAHFRKDTRLESKLLRLSHPLLRHIHRTYLTTQANLTEHDRFSSIGRFR